jgi:hypothetical protein
VTLNAFSSVWQLPPSFEIVLDGNQHLTLDGAVISSRCKKLCTVQSLSAAEKLSPSICLSAPCSRYGTTADTQDVA